MSREDVTRKALGLLAPVLGEPNSEELIDVLWNIEKVDDVRELRKYLRASGASNVAPKTT
jgi:hypothetical protein